MEDKNLMMKMLIGIYILVALMIIHMYCIHKKKLLRIWRKYNVKRFLVSVLLPTLIPIIMTIVMAYLESGNNSIIIWAKSSEGIFLISMSTISIIVFCLQFVEWRKEHEDRKNEWINRIFRAAYEKLYDVLRSKYSMYRTAALNHNGGTPSKKIEYDVFDNIRNICDAYRIAIAQITHIPTTHISISFIYHYNYPQANSLDKTWRWIIGKGSTLNIPLNDFVNKEDTLFHYLIDNDVDGVFYNRKQDASADGRYFYSSKDQLHACEGSVMASKVSFSSNSDPCCEGILIITTYGKQFVQDDSEHSANELQKIIEHDIFPCYKNLLKSELAVLFFRHKEESLPREDQKNDLPS